MSATIIRSIGVWVALVLALQGLAQSINPPADDIFRPQELTWIFLTMDPADKAFLQDPANALSEEYKSAVFRLKNSLMDTLLSNPVGVRLRGNTSRYAEKKSFKIDFREFGGKKFFEYKKFNLKANANDPSLVREALSLQQYRELNVPAARTHHVKLFINDEYMGVYLNVEQVDDVFLSMRFGHDDGYMYKCNWGANLDNPAQALDDVMFESEINKSTDTRVEISQFIQQLSQTDDAGFVAMIEQAFDVDNYLRQLAVEALIGHWDGYSYNQNNFYLFYNGLTGKVHFLPYDVDNTWGIDWVGQDWGSYDLNTWYMPGQPRPLTKRILAVPAYFAKYKDYIRELVQTTFNHAYIDPQLTAFQSLLGIHVYQDTYFPRAFGFTYNDFMNSFTQKMNNHVEYGLKPYLDERLRTAQEQMPEVITSAGEPGLTEVVFPNPSQQSQFYLQTQIDPATVVVYHHTGARVKTHAEPVDSTTYRIVLETGSQPGLYLVRSAHHTVKWVYR